ncbi:MAG: hypothetical protein IKZ95_01690 [Lachnospiraceae bacterium]|nr:hypothetical protein [Lachnospiraceae bacterium]
MLLLLLTGCARSGSQQTAEEPSSVDPQVVDIVEDWVNEVPDELYPISQEYFQKSQHPGTVVEFYYDTYESFSYEQKAIPLHKRAMVYLPFGYSEEEQYDVFYLIHGGWANETITLGMPGEESTFKNVIDHAIENGEIKPIIVVCPTFNNLNQNGPDANDYVMAMMLSERYHFELENDLIPAVEREYHTFAEGTSEEELIAARDHRAFGGFSIGSAATWWILEYSLDYFRYFLPISCGITIPDDEIREGAKGHDPHDFFIYVMTGTEDFAYSYEEKRMGKMREDPFFIEGSNEEEGNFAYRIKPGAVHDAQAAMVYFYNGMRFFWGLPPAHESE